MLKFAIKSILIAAWMSLLIMAWLFTRSSTDTNKNAASTTSSHISAKTTLHMIDKQNLIVSAEQARKNSNNVLTVKQSVTELCCTLPYS